MVGKISKLIFLIICIFLIGCTTGNICNTKGITGMYECKSSTTNREGLFKITTDIGEYYIIQPDQTHYICYDGFEPVPEYCLVTCKDENLCQ